MTPLLLRRDAHLSLRALPLMMVRDLNWSLSPLNGEDQALPSLLVSLTERLMRAHLPQVFPILAVALSTLLMIE
jgi:hypothetical protein